MKIPIEVQCKTCSQVFCCAKCRQKHEDNSHHELKAIRQICYICNNRPFPLRIDTKVTPSNLLVEHILKEHLPLRCNRCAKVFHTAADFKSIVRCLTNGGNGLGIKDNACHLERNLNIPTILETAAESPSELHEAENKENINENCSSGSSDRSSTHSVQAPQTAIKVKISKELRAITDPIAEIGDVNEAMLTPLSMINLRWKRKSRQSFDSMLSTTNNISAVNASEGAVQVPRSPTKKLVRTTSTPMMHGCLPYLKVANESYTNAMGQMSSIHSNSGSESDSKGDDVTPASPTSYEINKVRAIIRSRSKVAATPLRQVMSKSIQRAIAQHGYYSKMLAPGTQRKMSFNSTASSGVNSTAGSPSRGPLDLRTTPVLKRSSSESESGFHKTAKMVCLGKAQSEDSTGTSHDDASQTNSNYYDTHQNLDSLNNSINADQENRNNHKIFEKNLIINDGVFLKPTPRYYQDTPKVSSGMLKKVISFATPDVTRLGDHQSDDLDEDDSDDVWATPCSIPPRSFSCSALQDSRFDSLMTDDNSDASNSDDVFLPPARSKSCKQLELDSPAPTTGKLWNIVSNVIRLASRADIQEELSGTTSPTYSSESESDSRLSSTFARKAASFAGFLKNHLPGRQKQPEQRNSSSGSDEFSLDNQSGAKRRRTASIYTRPYESIGNNAALLRPNSSPLAKRKRIQGRQPIERMRNTSRSGSGSDF